MRPNHNARRMRARSLTTVVLALLAAGALVLSLTGARAAGEPGPGVLTLHLPRHVAYGRTLTISGAADRTQAGHTVALEGAAPGSSGWRRLAAGRVDRHGRFRFRVRARRSLMLRAVEQPALSGAAAAMAATVPASSSVRALIVSARLTLSQRSLGMLGGGLLRVAGRLLPARDGRTVRLQGHTGGTWRTVALGRTGRRGGFTLRARSHRQGERLRVVFAGDALNGAVRLAAGRTAVFSPAVASWYDDAGQTGCGFHAAMGVANKTLPCGTRLAFRYGGRTVIATVDDRGPYVAGRSFDLNQNTAAALGFVGVGTVWVAG